MCRSILRREKSLDNNALQLHHTIKFTSQRIRNTPGKQAHKFYSNFLSLIPGAKSYNI